MRYSSRIYSPECVFLAAQELKDSGSTHISNCGKELVVEFAIDDTKTTQEEFQHRFNLALNDASLRVILGDKTDAIRQMIVAQAFAPCDNLGQIVQAFEHHD